MGSLKWWLAGVVILVWILGAVFQIGGGFINILLVVAAIVFIIDSIIANKK